LLSIPLMSGQVAHRAATEALGILRGAAIRGISADASDTNIPNRCPHHGLGKDMQLT